MQIKHQKVLKVRLRITPHQIQKFKINEEKLFNVVPKNIERDKLEDFVIKACEFYSKHLRNKERER